MSTGSSRMSTGTSVSSRSNSMTAAPRPASSLELLEAAMDEKMRKDLNEKRAQLMDICSKDRISVAGSEKNALKVGGEGDRRGLCI